jgi:putative peptide modification system cyclase
VIDIFDEEFAIGSWRINRLQGTISGSNGEQHVTPKSMDVLICLTRQAGDLVTRNSIERQVWGSDRVSDELVTRCISELRHAFGDHPEKPDYIQTIPRRGYRLIAPVRIGRVTGPDPIRSSGEQDEGSVSLWNELQRRKVIRTAIAYGAIGWLLIQFADVVFARISEEMTSVIIALIILGFPIALVLAWMIERTRSGIRLERDWLENQRDNLLRQKNANILMIGISALAITGAAYILLQSRVGFTFENRDWVVVTHLDNLTDDPVLDESLDRAFRIRLNQSGYVNLLPDRLVRDTLQRMQQNASTAIDARLGIEIALREQARAVIAPSVARIGERYHLTAEILDPRRDRSVATRSVTADSRGDLLDAVEQLVDSVRVDLGEKVEGDAGAVEKPLERVTTGSLEALNAFSIAVRKDYEGSYQEAIDLLRRAIELDPDFATAHSMLGIVLMNTGHPESQFESYLRKALSLRDRLPERERLHVLATNSWLEEPRETERAWKLVTNLYPDDATAHHNLGIVYLQLLNQGDMALESFQQALALPNAHRESTLVYQGFAQMFVGRAADALISFETSWERSENPRNFALADGYIATFQYQKAKAFLDENSTSLSPIVSRYRRSRLVLYHLDRGEFTSALKELERWAASIPNEQSRAPLEIQMLRHAILEAGGHSTLLQEQLDRGLAAIDAVIEADSPPVSSYFHIIPILRTAAIAARNGRVEAAQAIFDSSPVRKSLTGFPVRTALHRVLGAEIALAAGDPSQAISLLGESLETVETFEAHSVFARAAAAAGDFEKAIKQSQWIRDNRGRAFSEWHEALAGRELNVLDWSNAAYRLGIIYEQVGDTRAATSVYDEFITHWQSADPEIPTLVDATRRRAEY